MEKSGGLRRSEDGAGGDAQQALRYRSQESMAQPTAPLRAHCSHIEGALRGRALELARGEAALGLSRWRCASL